MHLGPTRMSDSSRLLSNSSLTTVASGGLMPGSCCKPDLTFEGTFAAAAWRTLLWEEWDPGKGKGED